MTDDSTADVHADIRVSATSATKNTVRINVDMLGRPRGTDFDWWTEDPELTVHFSPSPIITSISVMQRSSRAALVAAGGRMVSENVDARVSTSSWSGTAHSWVSFDPLTPGRIARAAMNLSLDPTVCENSSVDGTPVVLGSVIVGQDVEDQESGFPHYLSATFEVIADIASDGIRIIVGPPQYSLRLEWAEEPMAVGFADTEIRSEAVLGGCQHTVCMGDEFPFDE